MSRSPRTELRNHKPLHVRSIISAEKAVENQRRRANRNASGEVKPKDQPKGEHMSHSDIHPEVIQSSEQLVAYLRRALEGKTDGSPEVHRDAGSLVLSYALGLLSIDEVRDLARRFDWACMDDRLSLNSQESGVISSHKGCGAAGLVFKLLADATRPQIRKQMEEYLGVPAVAALIAGGNSDKLGEAFSQRLAGEVGKKWAGHDVDDAHHHAAVAVLDMTGQVFASATPGEKGQRPFVIDAQANIAALWGWLAAFIARGDHSILDKEAQFTVAVVGDQNFDRDAFQKTWIDAQAQLLKLTGADMTQSEKIVLMFVDRSELVGEKIPELA
jgi:hypothetical protein